MSHQTPYNKIIVCGMYRSGSTLLFNILKYLCNELDILNLGAKTLTTHKVHLDWTNPTMPQKWAFIKESCEPENLVIYSRRDVRDVICSYIEREKCTLGDFRHAGKDYIKFLEWVVKNDELINKESVRNSNIKILRYENDIKGDENLPFLIDKILLYFKITSPRKNLELEQFKFLTTKNKCDMLDGLEGASQYWPNHLTDGSIGKYNTLLTKEELNSISNNKILKKWINKYYP